MRKFKSLGRILINLVAVIYHEDLVYCCLLLFLLLSLYKSLNTVLSSEPK